MTRAPSARRRRRRRAQGRRRRVAPARRADPRRSADRPSRASLDWDRRHALMRTHTALHVLCGVIWNDYRVARHRRQHGAAVGPDGLRVRPAARGLRPDGRGAGQRRAGRPTGRSRCRSPRAPRPSSTSDLIRTKVSLVPEHVAEVRVVDIVGLDKQADGGTHVRTHRRGRPRPRGQDRVEGQGQQAHPHRGRRCLTPADGQARRPRRPAARARAGGGRLQRRGRFGPARPRRRDRARPAARAPAVTAVSPSLAPDELADCAALAREWGLRLAHGARPTSSPTPGTSPTTATAAPTARRRSWTRSTGGCRARRSCSGSTSTISPTTAPARPRPPRRGAVFPLVDAGLTKAEVRALSRRLGLRTWDKPAAACLASRIPYGTPVTVGRLRTVAGGRVGPPWPRLQRAAGAPLRRHGPHRAAARRSCARSLERREQIVAAVRAAGYRYVTLDLEGLRSGNLNQALGRGSAPSCCAGASFGFLGVVVGLGAVGDVGRHRRPPPGDEQGRAARPPGRAPHERRPRTHRVVPVPAGRAQRAHRRGRRAHRQAHRPRRSSTPTSSSTSRGRGSRSATW